MNHIFETRPEFCGQGGILQHSPFNDNYNTGQPIQTVFDFTQDLQELDASAP